MWIKRENSIYFTHPKLCVEWDYEKNDEINMFPDKVSRGSDKKVWWKCDKNHSWLTSVLIRTNGHRCPYCSNRKVCKDNCLVTTNPELEKEWDYKKNIINPNNIIGGSEEKVWWKCKNEHSWRASISNRVHGGNCPYCCGRYVCKDNCLSTTNPELLSEWNYEKNLPLTPVDVTYGISKKVWWKCDKGHEWRANLNSRVRGVGCPYCSNHSTNNENCLLSTHPQLIKEWNYKKNKDLIPNNIVAGSHKKVWWKCDKGHEWIASISNRASKNNHCRCPYCSNKKVCGDNCLTTTNPKLAKEWDYEKNILLTPEKVTSGSGKKVWWKCKNGHSWVATIASRNSGCQCLKCKRIEFKNGQCFDSFIDAWYYLFLKNNNIVFQYNKKYNIDGKNHRFDFYIPETNTYIEVTGFYKSLKYKSFNFIGYLRNVAMKKKYVLSIGANFKFIQKILNRKEKQYILKYIKEN